MNASKTFVAESRTIIVISLLIAISFPIVLNIDETELKVVFGLPNQFVTVRYAFAGGSDGVLTWLNIKWSNLMVNLLYGIGFLCALGSFRVWLQKQSAARAPVAMTLVYGIYLALLLLNSVSFISFTEFIFGGLRNHNARAIGMCLTFLILVPILFGVLVSGVVLALRRVNAPLFKLVFVMSCTVAFVFSRFYCSLAIGKLVGEMGGG